MFKMVQQNHKSKLRHRESKTTMFTRHRDGVSRIGWAVPLRSFVKVPRRRQDKVRTTCACLLTTLNILHICTHTCMYAHTLHKTSKRPLLWLLTPWWQRSMKARVSAERHLEIDSHSFFTLCWISAWEQTTLLFCLRSSSCIQLSPHLKSCCQFAARPSELAFKSDDNPRIKLTFNFIFNLV